MADVENGVVDPKSIDARPRKEDIRKKMIVIGKELLEVIRGLYKYEHGSIDGGVIRVRSGYAISVMKAER